MHIGWTNGTLAAALLLALGGCGVSSDSAEEGDAGTDAAEATGVVDLPSLKAATWAGETWIANVKGTGPGAEQAQPMQGTKAQFQTCLAEMPGADAVAKVVSTALGDECTLAQLSNGEDPGYYRGSLTCTGGTVTIDGIINETMVGGALVRTMKAPEGNDEVTFEINLTSKPGEACPG